MHPDQSCRSVPAPRPAALPRPQRSCRHSLPHAPKIYRWPNSRPVAYCPPTLYTFKQTKRVDTKQKRSSTKPHPEQGGKGKAGAQGSSALLPRRKALDIGARPHGTAARCRGRRGHHHARNHRCNVPPAGRPEAPTHPGVTRYERPGHPRTAAPVLSAISGLFSSVPSSDRQRESRSASLEAIDNFTRASRAGPSTSARPPRRSPEPAAAPLAAARYSWPAARFASSM